MLFKAFSLIVFASMTVLPLFAAPFGIQSSSGSSYSGALRYDATNNVAFLTGETYGTFWNLGGTITDDPSGNRTSNCFLSILQIPEDASAQPDWIYKTRMGTQNVVESCYTLTLVHDNKLYIGGLTEEGGLLTSLRKPGSKKATLYGIVLDIDVDLRVGGANSPTTTQLLGGRLFHSTPIQSIRTLVPSSTGESLFVVSELSDSNQLEAAFDATAQEPNLILTEKYGRYPYLRVMKLNTGNAANGETLSSALWSREIATNLQPVHVASLELWQDSTLLLVGSAIGIDELAIPPDEQYHGAIMDWDGFVTLLDTSNGTIVGSQRFHGDGDSRLDRLESFCRQAGNTDYVYLVGSTNGDYGISGYNEDALTAFLLKVKVPGLTIEWSKQVDAKAGPGTQVTAEITGLRCAVTSDGKQVYVGGIVKDGGVVNYSQHQSYGKDDIWVGQADTETHEWNWIHQLGTSQDEALQDLVIDKNDDVLVLGNTKGSFFRSKPETISTDVFVMSLTRTMGDYPVPVDDGFVPDGTPTTAAPTGPAPANTPAPTPATPIPSPEPTPAPVSTGTAAPTIKGAPPPQQPDSIDGNNATNNSNGGAIAVAVVLSSVMLVALCFIWQQRANNRRRPKDSSYVLDYLKGFDDVEVDLKHSATGGWHGTYVNHDGGPRFFNSTGPQFEETLAFSNGSEMSPLTHSSVVHDSLFSLDDDIGDHDTARYGPGSLERRQSTYSGLVDVYNNTWNDLSHHKLPSRSQSLQPSREGRALVDVDFNDDGLGSTKPQRRYSEDEPWGKEII